MASDLADGPCGVCVAPRAATEVEGVGMKSRFDDVGGAPAETGQCERAVCGPVGVRSNAARSTAAAESDGAPLTSSSEWQEVPQARFLSWTDAEQLAYCAARDRDSASHEDDPWWCAFYVERAQKYEEAS